MKKTVFIIFIALVAAPIYIMSNAPVSITTGGTIEPESPLLKIEPGAAARLGQIKTGGANGLLLCWKEAAWRPKRPIYFAIDGDSRKPALVRKQVSHEHACISIHPDVATYRAKRKRGMEQELEPLPDPVFITVMIGDKSPVEFLARPDGSIRTWLITQTTFGSEPYGMLKSILSRASQYKPVSPEKGVALIGVWLILMAFTGYRVIFSTMGEGGKDD